MNKNAPADATPDELLRLIDSEIASCRQRRNTQAPSRRALLAIALCLIAFAAVGALLALPMLIANSPRTAAPEAGASANEGAANP